MTLTLKDQYFSRLGFTKDQAAALSSKPSKANLDQIMEAHLSAIPFENLAQHGLPHTPTLAVDQTAHKILEEKRGGFCYELNALLGELLEELGYKVKRVPGIVHMGPEVGFGDLATHLFLVASVSEEESYFVDVGFGEPALHSLDYRQLDVEQETPDGMVNRIVKCQENPEMAMLEWKTADGTWAPRLKWEYEHPGHEIASGLFQPGLEAVLAETHDNIFYDKLVVVKLDRTQKVTLAGNRLKITTPRFGPDSKATIKELEGIDEVQKVLKEQFGVLHPESLDISRSSKAAPEVWSQK